MRKLKVLVVDDDPSFANALAESLNLHGIFAEKETVSLNVEKRVRATQYDVVFLDAILPDYDGIEVMLDIATFSPSTKVLLATSKGGRELVAECMRIGACAFVEKNPQLSPETYVKKVLEVAAGLPPVQDEGVRRELLIKYLWRRTKLATKPQRRGRALEKLMKNVLESVPAVFKNAETPIVTGIREQIDIEFEVGGSDPFWSSYRPVGYAECKNWLEDTGPVQGGELHKFYGKLQGRTGCKLGFFIGMSGFAEGFKEIWVSVARGGILIVPINHRGLEELVNASEREPIFRKFAKNALRQRISL